MSFAVIWPEIGLIVLFIALITFIFVLAARRSASRHFEQRVTELQAAHDKNIETLKAETAGSLELLSGGDFTKAAVLIALFERRKTDAPAGGATHSKDFWDRVSSASTFLSSVVIAVLGLFFTHSYNERQAERDEAVKNQQIRVSQVELVQKFMPQLTGTSESKKLALIAISALGNTELATKIAALDRSQGSSEAMEAIASSGSTEAERGLAIKALQNIREFAPMLAQVEGGSSKGRLALKAAIQELQEGSFEEGGKNRGPKIRKYLASTNLPEGMPWAGAFISWCYSQIPGGSPIRPSGSFSVLMNEFDQKGWLRKANGDYTPQPGDVMFIKWASNAYQGGIVLRYSEGIVYSIEGNTNTGGSQEGALVLVKPRAASLATAYGHVPD